MLYSTMSLIKRTILKKKLITLICVVGVAAVAYGMSRDNDPVFVLGLVFIVAGYLLIRRELKASLRGREENTRFREGGSI